MATEITTAKAPPLWTRAGRETIRQEIKAAVDVPKQAVTIAVIALVIASLAVLAVVVIGARHAS